MKCLILPHVTLQGRFLNEKRLDAFSTICTDGFYKHAPKEAIYTI